MIDIDHALKILSVEVKNYDVPVVDLISVQTNDPFKILVATLLSARTKDEVTAKVCRRLFQEISSPKQLADASVEDLAELVYPVSFYKTKAKHLKMLGEQLVARGNVIPDSIEELTTLAGVGRKTANLVVTHAFKGDGICVDTHVHRICNRWGYVRTKSPLETEMSLRKKLPRKHWSTINTLLVSFGQHLCRPVSPHCGVCPLQRECPRKGVRVSR